VYPYQRRLGVNVAHHKRDGFLNLAISIFAGLGAKTIDSEQTPVCRKIRGSNGSNFAGGHILIIAASR